MDKMKDVKLAKLKNVDMNNKIWGKKEKPNSKFKAIYDPKNINMNKDTDGDGVKDFMDCDPLDPNKDGFISKTISLLKGRGFVNSPEVQEKEDMRTEEKELQVRVEQQAKTEAVRELQDEVAQQKVDRTFVPEGSVNYPPTEDKGDLPSEVKVSAGVVPLVASGVSSFFTGGAERIQNFIGGQGFTRSTPKDQFSGRTKAEKELIKRLETSDYNKTPANIKKAESLKKLYNIVEETDVQRKKSIDKEAEKTARDIAIMYATGKIASPILSKIGGVAVKPLAGVVSKSPRVVGTAVDLLRYGGETAALIGTGSKIIEATGEKKDLTGLKTLDAAGKEVTGQEALDVMMTRGESKVQETLKDADWKKRVLYSVAPVMFRYEDDINKAYTEQINTDLQALGYTKKEADKVIQEATRQKELKSVVEFVAILRSEALGNVVGGASKKAALAKIGGAKSLAKKKFWSRVWFGAKTKFRAGAVEGLTASQAVVESRYAGMPTTGYRDAEGKYQMGKAETIALGTGFGSVAAASFGAFEESVKGLKLKTKRKGDIPVGEKLSTSVGYVTDLPEAPGDIFTPMLLGRGRTTAKVKTFGVTPSVGTQTLTAADTQNTIKSNLDNYVNTKAKTNVDVLIDTKTTTPTPIKIDTKTDPFSEEFTKEETDDIVPTKTDTFVDTVAKTNTMVMTPTRTLYPFGRMPRGSGGRGYGTGGTGTRVNVNKIYDITKSFKAPSFARPRQQSPSQRIQGMANAGFGKQMNKAQKQKQLFGTTKKSRFDF